MHRLFLLVFVSFSLLLTSCVAPSGTPHAGSGNTGTGKVTTGNTVTEPQTPIILEHASLSGVILSSEAADTLRAKYASGVSRTYIPYMVFGSGTFRIPTMDVQVRYGGPFIHTENIYVDQRMGEKYRAYVEHQTQKQIQYYNAFFTGVMDIHASAATGFICGGISNIVAKTDGKLGHFVELSAIGKVTVDHTVQSEQFPLLGTAIILRDETGSTITDTDNLFTDYYISSLPTRYESFDGEKYFIFSVEKDEGGKPYSQAINSKQISEYEGIFNGNISECTLQSTRLPSHITLHFVAARGYTYDGLEQIDYRGTVQDYSLSLPSHATMKLAHVLMISDSGTILDASIDRYTKDILKPIPGGEGGFSAPTFYNQVYCIEDECRVRFRSGSLDTLRSLELFYDEK